MMILFTFHSKRNVFCRKLAGWRNEIVTFFTRNCRGFCIFTRELDKNFYDGRFRSHPIFRWFNPFILRVFDEHFLLATTFKNDGLDEIAFEKSFVIKCLQLNLLLVNHVNNLLLYIVSYWNFVNQTSKMLVYPYRWCVLSDDDENWLTNVYYFQIIWTPEFLTAHIRMNTTKTNTQLPNSFVVL